MALEEYLIKGAIGLFILGIVLYVLGGFILTKENNRGEKVANNSLMIPGIVLMALPAIGFVSLLILATKSSGK